MPLGLDLLIWVAGILVAIIIVIIFVIVYNSLIMLRKNIDKSLANIDVILKQRVDELPKLVKVAKGYAAYEKRVIKEMTKLRTTYNRAKTVKEKAAFDSVLTSAMKNLFAVAENYPKLEASQNFKQLQERISGLENELADRREFYNDSVTLFNTRIEQIPYNVFAGMLGYKSHELFKTTAKEKMDVKIDLSGI